MHPLNSLLVPAGNSAPASLGIGAELNKKVGLVDFPPTRLRRDGLSAEASALDESVHRVRLARRRIGPWLSGERADAWSPDAGAGGQYLDMTVGHVPRRAAGSQRGSGDRGRDDQGSRKNLQFSHLYSPCVREEAQSASACDMRTVCCRPKETLLTRIQLGATMRNIGPPQCSDGRIERRVAIAVACTAAMSDMPTVRRASFRPAGIIKSQFIGTAPG